ncbi:unnamed protein product [Amoebophrya sp. A25]|nr:unnamed protein product [Amoebophrya sp. A25]|eukprot:GSA25T00003240001.1
MASSPPKGGDWDGTLLPLIKCVLGKKGIEQRQAAEVDRKKVDFFRGKDFAEWMLKNDAVIKRRCHAALDEYLEGKGVADEEDVAKLGQALVDKGFIAPALYAPLIDNKKEESATDRKRKKWPDRLKRVRQSTFDTQGFYICIYEGSHHFRYFMLALMLLVILGGCLFPVWPMWARVFAWYIALSLCTLYFCTEFLRMSCYSLGWIVGLEFWILPNLNDEYCSFMDSFKPIWSCERRRDGLMMLVSRVAVLGVIGLAMEELSKTHSISDVADFVKGSYQDIIEWGENKAMMLEGPQERMKLPSVEELMKEEQEEGASAAAASTKPEETAAEGEEETLFEEQEEKEEM